MLLASNLPLFPNPPTNEATKMKFFVSLAAATLLLVTTVSALPYASSKSQPPQHQQSKRGASAISILETIAPTSNTCDNAPLAGDCATASQAAAPIIASFTQYSITTAPEQAALLSWMAFESLDFKYDHNVSPGTPGQGCRNMMMPGFVKKYAAVVQGADASSSDPATVLNSVIAAGGDWGAAAWFYNTQCSDAIKNGVKTGGKAGWEAWITGCVQTTVTDARTQYWQRAAQALGMSTS